MPSSYVPRPHLQPSTPNPKTGKVVLGGALRAGSVETPRPLGGESTSGSAARARALHGEQQEIYYTVALRSWPQIKGPQDDCRGHLGVDGSLWAPPPRPNTSGTLRREIANDIAAPHPKANALRRRASPPPSFGSESARSRAPARPTESSTSGRRAAREAQGGAHERPPRFRATEAQARRGRGGGAGSTGRGSRGGRAASQGAGRERGTGGEGGARGGRRWSRLTPGRRRLRAT
ncbi:unnamed protein product [Prorocentrum cordatum]|uniref:Uncharacterized protein n=1 Tax=Prorocentrum cordatum TaxID=2364126 RepID=A0ABN9S237_9DINO|nr:unnamed protein product [Polarella glacialis]